MGALSEVVGAITEAFHLIWKPFLGKMGTLSMGALSGFHCITLSIFLNTKDPAKETATSVQKTLERPLALESGSGLHFAESWDYKRPHCSDQVQNGTPNNFT